MGGPSVDDEATDSMVADKRLPVIERCVVVGYIITAHLFDDHLSDLLLKRQLGECFRRPPLSLRVARHKLLLGLDSASTRISRRASR